MFGIQRKQQDRIGDAASDFTNTSPFRDPVKVAQMQARIAAATQIGAKGITTAVRAGQSLG